MKKLLTAAAIVAAFALAQAPAAFAADAAPAAKAASAKAPAAAAKTKLTKAEVAACKKDAKADKEGKKPSKEEVTAAYEACVKTKTDAKKGGEAAPVKDAAPKTEEKK